MLMTIALIALPSNAIARDRSKPAKPKGNPGDWFPVNSYPADAKRNGQQGRVSVQLAVDKTGVVTACTVVASSGSPSLDKATCDLAIANAKYTPALDAKGQPTDATVALPGVRWELMEDRPIKLEGPWRAGAKLQIDLTGKVTSCSEQRVGPVPAEVEMCLIADRMPLAFGLFARAGSTAPAFEAVIETSLSLDGVPALPMTYEADGRMTLKMSVLHFDVGIDGKAGNCQIQAESGPGSGGPCGKPPGPFLPIEKPRGITVKLAISRAATP
jgi:TonB family protein